MIQNICKTPQDRLVKIATDSSRYMVHLWTVTLRGVSVLILLNSRSSLWLAFKFFTCFELGRATPRGNALEMKRFKNLHIPIALESSCRYKPTVDAQI